MKALLPVVMCAAVAAARAESPAPPETKPAETRPVTPESIHSAIDRGVKFLVSDQQPDGSWGTGRVTRGFEVFSMVPGSQDAFRVGTTALAVMALREAGAREAHDKGLKYLVEHGEARRDDGMLLYNIWAHLYALQALSLELQRKPAELAIPAEKIKAAALWHLDRMQKYEVFLGGWNYYDFNAQTERPSMEATSFGTAAGLVALWEARRAGLDVPQKMVDRAVRRLEEMRLPNGAYLYSGEHRYAPMHRANYVRGSVGRTQACNYALWIWGSKKVGEKEVREGLEMFFREHIFIEMGRKRQYPHEAWYATAPYYYYFGHYYAGRLLERLGEGAKKEFGTKLAEQIAPKQDPDGSWWDFAMWDYHKPYGTAFSVMTLLRCQ